MDIEIRPARPHEHVDVHRIDRTVWDPRHSPAPAPTEARAFDDAEETLVALVRDRVVGYVALASPTPLVSSQHVRQVVGLAVDPEHRRSGIARRLLDAAATRVREQGVSKLTLRVLASNLPARRLYEHAGFETEGLLRKEFLIAGSYVDDLLLARHLDGE